MFATWTSHANRAPDATYAVHHVDALNQPTTSAVSVVAHPNRATNPRYVIDYVDNVTALPQSQKAVVNQQTSGGVFNTLATLDLQAGSTVTVTLSDEADGYVIADAVRFVNATYTITNGTTTQTGAGESADQWR